MDKFLGKRLDGRYEIRELIGVGGMADVYKAYDKIEDKMVALKILKEEFLNNDEFLRRFRNESKAIAVLSHPNIVKVFDVNFGNNIQYIVMEYIDGITLKDYIQQQKILRWKETVHFTVQILRALQHAHDKGIVHRDVKPQNIMLLQDGTIKVMDFGIARFARDERKSTTNKAIGSVHYISPEQAKGEMSDEKSDIYSLGVMMFEMLTGKLPFDGKTPESIAVMQMEAMPKKPRQINETIPEGLEEIIIRSMQKDPAMRYQTAAEMLRDIDEFKKNPSIVFEYKYFSDEGSTKYFNTVGGSKLEDIDDAGDEEEIPQKSKTIPVLAGIASAFVVVTAVIVFVLFNLGSHTNEIVMPNFVGLNYEEVKNDPQYSKLKINPETTQNNDQYPAGTIFEQDIREGRRVKEGTIVNVKVSKGKKQVEVPDVYNKSSSEAEDILKEKGFTYKPVPMRDPYIANDYVIKTDPPRKETADEGSEIIVYISSGKTVNMVTVPNVLGKMSSEAKAEIESKGLVCKIKSVESTQPEGKVLSQSPGVKNVAEGSTVTINVSTGTAPSKTLSFTVALPSGISGNYDFAVYLDGAQKSKKTLNVAGVSKFEFSLTEKRSGREVAVMVAPKGSSDYKLFAKYNVDFIAGAGNTQPTVKDDDVFFSFPSSSTPSSSSKPASSSSSQPNSSSSSSDDDEVIWP
ncbi:MAG: prkC [Oscillospiraceae bacterium]|nr:prkC [Oscillospiraceae bacterium]